MKTTTLNSLAQYLKQQDRIYERGNLRFEGKEMICEVLAMLKEMPDADIVLHGSFFLSNYQANESEIFYLPDMLQMLVLLTQGYYVDFIHELNDFIYYKILRSDKEQHIRYLPTDIKNALIFTIEKGLKQEV